MSIPIFSVVGKIVLITGGGGGLGKAFALSFAEAGADVAICDLSDKSGELKAVGEEIKQLGRRSLAIKADVTRKVDVENMVDKVAGEFGGIDILINNAGITTFDAFLDTDEYTWDQTIDIDLKGCFLCSQAAARIMIERKMGNIINMASMAGLKARSPRAAYCVAKAGVVMLTRVLALELGKYNIRVNAIAPGAVRTPISEPFFSNPEAVKKALADTPLGRLGETSDIIGAALFLASDAASWITGHTIVIDGGFMA